MSTPRAQRVAGEIQRALFDILLHGLRDPRVKPITITEVECTADLRIARVRFVLMGGGLVDGEAAQRKALDDSNATLEGLRSAAGYIRRQLSRKINLKYSPTLEFFLDERYFESVRMVEYLEEQERSSTVSSDGADDSEQ